MPVKYRSLKEQNGVGPKTNGTVNGTERDRQKTNGTVKERNGKDQKMKTAAGYWAHNTNTDTLSMKVKRVISCGTQMPFKVKLDCIYKRDVLPIFALNGI